ncbi:MAG: RusA family crossover junction endodeoxyribonuclease [Ruminococcus sp.]
MSERGAPSYVKKPDIDNIVKAVLDAHNEVWHTGMIHRSWSCG